MSIPHADLDRNDEYLRTDCPGMLTLVSPSAYFNVMECNRCGFMTTIRNGAQPQRGRNETRSDRGMPF